MSMEELGPLLAQIMLCLFLLAAACALVGWAWCYYCGHIFDYPDDDDDDEDDEDSDDEIWQSDGQARAPVGWWWPGGAGRAAAAAAAAHTAPPRQPMFTGAMSRFLEAADRSVVASRRLNGIRDAIEKLGPAPLGPSQAELDFYQQAMRNLTADLVAAEAEFADVLGRLRADTDNITATDQTALARIEARLPPTAASVAAEGRTQNSLV